MNQPAISFKHVTKMYGTKRGIENISFDVMPGDVYGFLGPNGAGKSTAIKTMMNFLAPTSGSISMLGLDSVQDSVEIKKRVGYLAGDIALYPDMTGGDLLKYLSSFESQTDWRYVDTLVEKLQAQLHKPIKTLSKGNKQKIGIIQALMHRPELVIFDEPTSGLDPLMKEVFYHIVLDMKMEGKTVFVSSHDLTEVQKICSKASFIKDGLVVATEEIGAISPLRNFTVSFSNTVGQKDISNIPGVSYVQSQKDGYSVHVEGDINPFILFLSKQNVTSLTTTEVALEELFMHYYTA